MEVEGWFLAHLGPKDFVIDLTSSLLNECEAPLPKARGMATKTITYRLPQASVEIQGHHAEVQVPEATNDD